MQPSHMVVIGNELFVAVSREYRMEVRCTKLDEVGDIEVLWAKARSDDSSHIYCLNPVSAGPLSVNILYHEASTTYSVTLEKVRDVSPVLFKERVWDYPLSDGQSEKPLKDRILSMDHPVTEELNGLCKNGSLFTRGGRHPTQLKDWEPDLGNYTGSVGNGTLRVELTVEGRENRGLPENHTLLIAPIMHHLIGFLYPTGVGEREAKVVILRFSGMNEETYVSRLGAKFFRGFTRVDQQGWDMILYETRNRFE
ncbi:hypothetical protein FOZ62_003915 [Perkinsus olseni]|uniref:Uncharacterized protein n=1 Tax=Perkinsus olseni TaxID=32597 RepID=A0A7J6SYH3_PEROL|nr:hypothetical protein FOZ62_003915 [Perkinsus olseni]